MQKPCIDMNSDQAKLEKMPKISVQKTTRFNGGSFNGDKVTNEVYQNDGTSVEVLLTHTIPELYKNAPDVGEDKFLFRFLPDLLTGDAREDMQAVLEEEGIDDDEMEREGSFKPFFEKFLAKYTNSTNMQDTLFRYLEHDCKKRFDQEPHAFNKRFKLILNCAQWFEGIKAYPSEDELKDWYISCFSKKHVAQYARARNYETDTRDDITKYMTMIHTEEVANGTISRLRRELKPKKHDEDRSSRRDKNCGKSSRDTRRRKEYGKRDYDDRRQGSSKRGLSYNDPCPNHPDADHVWGKCRLNPKNKEGEPSRKKYKSDGKKQHSHHADHDSDSSDGDESYTTASSRSSVESEKKASKKSSKRSSKSKSKSHSHHVHLNGDTSSSSSDDDTMNADPNLYGDSE